MFTKNSRPGLFAVIEGLDGSGSSTQCEMVANVLRLQGKNVFVTKEPTNNVVGGLIRGSLTGELKFPPDCLQLLFAADRAHHLQREIIPILEGQNILIADRYFWSTIAFGSLDLDKNWLLSINQFFLLPDITIFLKVDPSESLKRIQKSRFSLELFEEKEKMNKVWQTYEWLAKKFPKNIVIIDADQGEKEITEKILSLFLQNNKFKKLSKL